MSATICTACGLPIDTTEIQVVAPPTSSGQSASCVQSRLSKETLDPVSLPTWPANYDDLKCALDAVSHAEDIRQHQGVFHGHTASLAHVRWAGMSSIPHQDHPAAIPLVELDPFNRPNVELLITL